MRRAAILLMCLVCSGSVRSSPAETLAYASFVADAYSTRYALDRGADEANPIYGSDPSDGALLVGAAARGVAVYALARSDFAWREQLLLALACVTFGIAGANLTHDRPRAERVQGLTIGVTIPLFTYGILR